MEAFFPGPSRSCLRPSVPSCSRAGARGPSLGMVAARGSQAEGPAAEREGSSSMEPLSLRDSDSSSTVESGTPELGSTSASPASAPDGDGDWV